MLVQLLRRRPVAAPRLRHLCDSAGAADASPGRERKDHEEHDLREQLLAASLLEVPKHGWSVGALTAGAESLGLSPAAHGILPRGPIELVRHFSLGCDAALRDELSSRSEVMQDLTVQNRLIVAMQTRLSLLEPHVGTWPQALALRALPANLSESLTDAHSLTGVLLDACGEDARAPMAPGPLDDPLKRLSLGAVYGAAELYMLTDKSPAFNDTWRFLEQEVRADRAASLPLRAPSPDVRTGGDAAHARRRRQPHAPLQHALQSGDARAQVRPPRVLGSAEHSARRRSSASWSHDAAAASLDTETGRRREQPREEEAVHVFNFPVFLCIGTSTGAVTRGATRPRGEQQKCQHRAPTSLRLQPSQMRTTLTTAIEVASEACEIHCHRSVGGCRKAGAPFASAGTRS